MATVEKSSPFVGNKGEQLNVPDGEGCISRSSKSTLVGESSVVITPVMIVVAIVVLCIVVYYMRCFGVAKSKDVCKKEVGDGDSYDVEAEVEKLRVKQNGYKCG